MGCCQGLQKDEPRTEEDGGRTWGQEEATPKHRTYSFLMLRIQPLKVWKTWKISWRGTLEPDQGSSEMPEEGG